MKSCTLLLFYNSIMTVTGLTRTIYHVSIVTTLCYTLHYIILFYFILCHITLHYHYIYYVLLCNYINY